MTCASPLPRSPSVVGHDVLTLDMGRLCSAPLFPRSNTSNQVKVAVGVRPRDSLKGGDQFGITVTVLMDGAEMAPGMLAGGPQSNDAQTDGPTEPPMDESSAAPMDEPTEASTAEPSEASMDGPSEASTDESTDTPNGEFMHAGS